ncbi:hypothetical protein Ahia01_001417700, partial [Argonauta hians]
MTTTTATTMKTLSEEEELLIDEAFSKKFRYTPPPPPLPSSSSSSVTLSSSSSSRQEEWPWPHFRVETGIYESQTGSCDIKTGSYESQTGSCDIKTGSSESQTGIDCLTGSAQVVKETVSASSLPSSPLTTTEVGGAGEEVTTRKATTLSGLRDRLNALKDRLSCQDIKRWHAHTGATHLGGAVCGTLRNKFNPELCTQAWCKFLEILSSYPLVAAFLGDPKMRLRSAHLCEAPGSFITCLNHFLVSRGYPNGRWKWMASTLNPYYEGNDLGDMVADDRFIRATLARWKFGDGTGNILEPANCRSLFPSKSSSEKDKYNLVTADGSINCQNNPSMQEATVSQLHYCEVYAALNLLARGGSLVVKFFTLFENNSVALIYVLVKCFTEVNVFKPSTSKAGNSEVYVVCLGFHGDSDGHLRNFISRLESVVFNKAVFESDMWDMTALPQSFLSEHLECCRRFLMWQESAILRNLSLYDEVTGSPRLQRLSALRAVCLGRYLSQSGVKYLPHRFRVINEHHKHAYGKTFESINFQNKLE